MITYVIMKQELWPEAMAEREYDVELLRRIAAGEDSALVELYTLHGRRLYAFALRLTGDAARAEDVVQDTLVAVWRTAGRYRGEGRVLAWLLGIVPGLIVRARSGPGNGIEFGYPYFPMENSISAPERGFCL